MKVAEQTHGNAPGATLDVSIIIPCLNEEKSVGEVVAKSLQWLDGSGLTGEVLVIDNRSSDRTAEAAQEAGARVIFEGLRGKGNAFQTGMRESRGRWIVMADGDATYDMSQLDAIIEPLKEGYDMVIGNRLTGQIEANAMPRLHRYIGNPMFNALISLITGQRMGDVLTGLRSFTREAWETMAPTSTGFELESEMCLRAGRNHLKVKDVPVAYAVRRAPSNLHGLTHGWAITRFIILESADLILILPGILAIIAGVIALAIGVASSSGVDVGSVKWQPVFAGGILVPGGIAFLTAGVAAKWLAWRRGVAEPGRLVRALQDYSKPVGDYVLLTGVASILAGGVLDAYLIWKWANDETLGVALGLGAVAQTLMVSGLSLMVAAVLIGVLRAGARADAAMAEREAGQDAGTAD